MLGQSFFNLKVKRSKAFRTSINVNPSEKELKNDAKKGDEKDDDDDTKDGNVETADVQNYQDTEEKKVRLNNCLLIT